MQRIFILFAACVALMLASLSAPILAQSLDDQRNALSKARADTVAAEQRAQALEARALAANSEVDRAKGRMAALAARVQASESDIATAEARIKLIDALRDEHRGKLAEKQAPVARLLGALQLMSRRPAIIAFVQPGSTRDIVHLRAVLETMIPEVRRRTEGLRGEIAKAQQLRASAAQALGLLKQSQQKLAQQRTELASEVTRFRAQFQQLAQSAMAEEDRAIAMGEKARDIVDLIDQLGVSAEVGNALATLPGPLLRPEQPGESNVLPEAQVAGKSKFPGYRLPVTGSVTKGLGEVSAVGVRSRGLTIATRPGAQVIAPAGGRVIFAGPYRGYDKIVIIDHGSSWTSLVTNLAALDARVGDSLSEGQPIGRAGNDRPNITIELRQGATPVDIIPIIG